MMGVSAPILIEILKQLEATASNCEAWVRNWFIHAKGSYTISLNQPGTDDELSINGPVGTICGKIVVGVENGNFSVRWYLTRIIGEPGDHHRAWQHAFIISIADPNSLTKVVDAIILIARKSEQTMPLVDDAIALTERAVQLLQNAEAMVQERR